MGTGAESARRVRTAPDQPSPSEFTVSNRALLTSGGNGYQAISLRRGAVAECSIGIAVERIDPSICHCQWTWRSLVPPRSPCRLSQSEGGLRNCAHADSRSVLASEPLRAGPTPLGGGWRCSAACQRIAPQCMRWEGEPSTLKAGWMRVVGVAGLEPATLSLSS